MTEKTMKAPAVRRERISNTQLLMLIAIGIFVIMYGAAMMFMKGAFLTWQQFMDLFNENAPLILIACSLTIVMINGGIDISVGGVIGLTAMACCKFLNYSRPESVPLTILLTLLLALGIGLAFGLLQGFMVSYLNIQPFIVTLAGMFLSRGLTTILAPKIQVSDTAVTSVLNYKVKIPFLIDRSVTGGKLKPLQINEDPALLEIGAFIAIAMIILVYLMLRFTRLGRNVYAVGGNRQSALMLGINVKRTRFLSHVISSLLAGLAGFAYLTHNTAAGPNVATRGEMDAIASSIIGGTLLTGGVGNVFGSLFGVLILAVIQKIIALSPTLNESWIQQMASGVMLGLFILLQSVILSRHGRGKSAKKAQELSPAKG